METQTVQYLSINAMNQSHKPRDITYRLPIIRCPVLHPIHGQQPTTEVVVLFHQFDRLL